MTTNSLIQKQYEIIQRSYRAMNDYERAKTEAEARFKREKEAAEAAGRVNADETIEPIRHAIKSTQDAINKSKWRDKVNRGVPNSPFPAIATSEDKFARQV